MIRRDNPAFFIRKFSATNRVHYLLRRACRQCMFVSEVDRIQYPEKHDPILKNQKIQSKEKPDPFLEKTKPKIQYQLNF
jgi:hypothetical protein